MSTGELKNTVFYIGNFIFPDGSAGGKRVLSNGKILRSIGFDVQFIGVSKKSNYNGWTNCVAQKYDAFTYYELPYPSKASGWLHYKKTFENVWILVKNVTDNLKNLKMVILYGAPSLSLFISKILKECQKSSIPVIIDVVEWHCSKTGKIAFDIVKKADTEYKMRILNKKATGIIAISNTIADYYKNTDIPVIIIPPLSTYEPSLQICTEMNTGNTIRLIYAGRWPKIQKVKGNRFYLKDRLDLVVRYLSAAKRNGAVFVFNVYGLTKDEYITLFPEQENEIQYLGESIQFMGIVPNKDVLVAVRNADFTILIRNANKINTMGFPTKISESISSGTPVITTNTSDMDEYVFTEATGFILSYDDDEAIEKLTGILLNISREKICFMKTNCMNISPFYFGRFTQKMQCFIEKVLRQPIEL